MKKTLILSAIALTAASVAVPAAAQSYGHGYRGVSHRAAQIDQRIDRGERNGAITRQESWRLRSQLSGIVRLERQYAYNGINRREAYDLDRRYDQLQAQVRWERRDDDRYGYGRGGGYYRY